MHSNKIQKEAKNERKKRETRINEQNVRSTRNLLIKMAIITAFLAYAFWPFVNQSSS